MAKYSADDVLKVFRAVATHIEENPDLMKEEGVFRLSGDSNKNKDVVSNILKKKNFTQGVQVHELIGALKEVLKDNVLLENNSPHIQDLRRAFSGLNTGDPASIKQVANEIDKLIDKLNSSKDKKDRAIAEVLQTYIYLTQLASKHAEVNQMTPGNLSIAAIAPLFYNNIIIEKDPMALLTLTSKAKPVAEQAIQSEKYSSRKPEGSGPSVAPEPEPKAEKRKAPLLRSLTTRLLGAKDPLKREVSSRNLDIHASQSPEPDPHKSRKPPRKA